MSLLARIFIGKAVENLKKNRTNAAILELCNAAMVLAGFGPDLEKPIILDVGAWRKDKRVVACMKRMDKLKAKEQLNIRRRK